MDGTAEIPVSLVTDEMVTRAYRAFMRDVVAVTPRQSGDPDGFIHPRTAMRKALEAALGDPACDRLEVLIRRGTTIDGAVVALCPAADGTITADVCIDGPPVP